MRTILLPLSALALAVMTTAIPSAQTPASAKTLDYGNVLSIYDRVFGTFTPAEHACSVVYGLDDADPVQVASLPGLLSMPFRELESTTP